MDQTRFLYLLDAYGAGLNRWPEGEREAARALLASDTSLQPAWHEAMALDDLMALPAAVPSYNLRERVIASAAGAGLRARRERRMLWTLWSGAGVAATVVAGAMLGVLLAQHMTAPLRAETVFYQASLQGADDTEVLGQEYASLEGMR